MLKSLHIRNYALIKELDLKPVQGLNIVTGETGAGKSIMLGAIGLLLGNRADTRVLFNKNEKCIIEGAFQVGKDSVEQFFEMEDLDYEPICIIRREINPQNKSRAFINDTPVTLDVLKRLGNMLMDIHSQHETLLLGSAEFQVQVLDSVAGSSQKLKTYQEIYSNHRKLKKHFEELNSRVSEQRKELDYHNYLFTELSEAELNPEVDPGLEDELNVLENAEDIKTRLNGAIELLDAGENAALPLLQSAVKYLDQVSRYSESLNNLKSRLESASIELKDISQEISDEEGAVELNYERIEEIRERLSVLFNLFQKHGVQSVEDLIKVRNDLEQKVQEVDNLDEELKSLKEKIDREYTHLLKIGQELSENRASVIPELKEMLVGLLREVGMPNASFEVNLTGIEPGPKGIDKVDFLFSSNKGIPAQELKNAASGGEFSRLMLCIKYILAQKTQMPVIVFDEIDTGISGEIAIKVGKILKQMAAGHQIISISHLPQIAALGDAHFFVYKSDSEDTSVSSIKKLDENERLHNIAVMIGGDNPSQTAINSAKELMEIS